MKTKTCAFVGNEDMEDEASAEIFINDFVQRFLEDYRVNVFMFRGRGEFDELAYKIVSINKCDKPYIRRMLVVPVSQKEHVHKVMGYYLYNGMLYEDVEFIENFRKQFLDVVKDKFSYFMISHSDTVIINTRGSQYPNRERLFDFALRKRKQAILL